MISKEALDNKYKALESSRRVQLTISKATALFMFKSTHEPAKNYANLSVDNDSINHIGIEYIDLGCRYFALEDYSSSSACFTKGAECLETIHSLKENELSYSNYYGLLASLAFYAGFQYSRSFILIKKFEEETPIASLLSLFLKRNFSELTDVVEKMVISQRYDDDQLSQADDIEEACGKAFEINIAKSLYCVIQYFYTGDETLIDTVKEKLNALLDIAKLESLVDLWWVVRLILIIVDGFAQSSLWNMLGAYIDLKRENSLARQYVLALIYKQMPVTELFLSQRAVLPQLFSAEQSGIIVSIPTSSGKTRIAEMAILNALISNPEGKILYIAPFRSLAYEIENSFGDLFATAKIRVSHLYGGSLFTSLDVEELSEASIVIATPEKVKAIFRCQQDFFKELSLVVMDEGHLLGREQRQVGNEIFYEELRCFLKGLDCKYLLLSAVLPNTDDLAKWLTGTDNNTYHTNWRPSKQICGILNWNGVSVGLDWYKGNVISSFNRNFVVRYELPRKPRERTKHYYPKNRVEAIVETARKLESFGSTLIYVPIKKSCLTYAEAYAKSMKVGQTYSFKNELERRIFELVCKETYNFPTIYDYATKGIFYHNADLFTDVRITMEKLMQSEHPRVIIATSTLSQGVNLGVSTVILSSVYNDRKPISNRDFWNLAGRAGRAFADEEGKILVAFEYDQKKTKWKNECKKSYIIKDYFENSNLDFVTSGLLEIVSSIHNIAVETGTTFGHLLELIADNKPLPAIDNTTDVESLMSELDDCLLSMHGSYSEDKMSLNWIEDIFSKSLAYIQASKGTIENVTSDNVISFVKSRVAGILKRIEGRDNWEYLIQSGLPLQKSIDLDSVFVDIVKLVIDYRLSDKTIEGKVLLLKNIETLISNLPNFNDKYIGLERIDEIREKWLKGTPLCEINPSKNDEIAAIKNYYSYELPWFLNGMASMIRADEEYDEDMANVLSELALLVETGLPNKRAVKIYRSGVRSRACATEFSEHMSGIFFGEYYPSSLVTSEIIQLSPSWSNLSERGKAWVEILKAERNIKQANKISPISSFSIKDDKHGLTMFKVRIIDGKKYFISLDLDEVIAMEPSKRDFSHVEHLKGIYFKYNCESDEYDMLVLNPYINVK